MHKTIFSKFPIYFNKIFRMYFKNLYNLNAHSEINFILYILKDCLIRLCHYISCNETLFSSYCKSELPTDSYQFALPIR